MVETVTRWEPTSSAKPTEVQSKQTKRNIPLRLLSSTAIITILLFAGANIAIEKIDPLERLFWTGLTGARQHIFVSKLPKLMSSGQNPDVLVLGSSVSLYPAVRADDELAGKKARWDFWYERNVILPYDKVEFLAHHLTKSTGKKVTVTNASVAGSLVSDQFLILKKFLAAGKKTKQIVVCFSPRDFLDNNRIELDKTPTHNVLGDWTSLPELIQKGESWQKITDATLGNLSAYYLHRREFSQFLTNLTAKAFCRPVNLYEAAKQLNEQANANQNTRQNQTTSTQTTARTQTTTNVAWKNLNENQRNTFFNPSNSAIYRQPPNTLYHLDEYEHMYLPVDEKQFAAQVESFNNFLILAAEKNIPVIVVNTPLPKENTALLPVETYNRYKAAMIDGCEKTGATFLDPAQEVPYSTHKDFEDASHMNTSGGIKFYTSILDSIKQTNTEFAG